MWQGTLRVVRPPRRVPQPFGTSVDIKSGDAVAEFKGTMTDPLNFDGVTGPIYVNVPFLSDLQDAIGFSIDANLPVALAGTLTKKGDDWDLPDGNGLIDDDAFTMSGHMKEGGRGEPDDVRLSAVFDRLDLNLLTDPGAKRPKGTKAPRTVRSASIPLYVDEHPGTLLDATVDVKQLIYYRFNANDIALKAKIVPKKISVETLSLLYAGTRAVISGAAEQKGPVAQIDLAANLSDGDLRTLLRSVGAAGPHRRRLLGAGGFDDGRRRPCPRDPQRADDSAGDNDERIAGYQYRRDDLVERAAAVPQTNWSVEYQLHAGRGGYGRTCGSAAAVADQDQRRDAGRRRQLRFAEEMGGSDSGQPVIDDGFLRVGYSDQHQRAAG